MAMIPLDLPAIRARCELAKGGWLPSIEQVVCSDFPVALDVIEALCEAGQSVLDESVVEFDDARIRYVTYQVTRGVMENLRAALARVTLQWH